MSLRIRRGITPDLPTPVEGELLYTTDTGKLYVGFYDSVEDEVTPKIVGSNIQDDPSPSLGGSLDLNNNNIVGIGNIDIDGYIKATGLVELGDGVEDNIIVGGQIASSLIPKEDGIYDLGESAARWKNGYFSGLTVDTNLQTESLTLENLYKQDSSVLFDSLTDTISVDNIISNQIQSNLQGSVYYEDSNIFFDSENGTINLNGVQIEGEFWTLDNDKGIIEFISPTDTKAQVRIISDFPDYSMRVDGLTTGNSTIGNFINTSRGTLSSREAVEPGDFLFVNAVTAWDGNDTIASSGIIHTVDPNRSVNFDSVPGSIKLLTFDEDSVSLGKGISIDSLGNVAIAHDAFNFDAREALDVNGSGIFNGSVNASSFIGTLAADDSTILIDAINGEVTAPIRNIEVLGEVGAPASNPDSLTPSEWLKITVNGSTRYLPLYT